MEFRSGEGHRSVYHKGAAPPGFKTAVRGHVEYEGADKDPDKVRQAKPQPRTPVGSKNRAGGAAAGRADQTKKQQSALFFSHSLPAG